MKKNFKLMLVALMTLFSFSSAMAEELVGTTQYGDDGFQYVIETMAKTGGKWGGTVSVKQNTFSGTAIVIKSTVDITVEGEVGTEPVKGKVTYKIVKVAKDGFKNVTSATSVQIGSNVKEIGINAFGGCKNVTTITFDSNSNNMEIGASAFNDTKVTELDLTPITGTLATVNKWWTANTTLQTIKFPAKVTTIVDEAFAGFTKLKNVEFKAQTSPYVGLTIGTGAFKNTPIEILDLTEARITDLNPLFEYNNVTLKKVIMSKYVVNLADMALADCIQLAEVDFSQSTKLQTIGDGALSNTVVPEYDFTNCYEASGTPLVYTSNLNFSTTDNPFVNGTTTTNKNLTTVKLPKHPSLRCPVTTIGTTFANCEVLTTIESLDVSNVTIVDDGAFANDISLTSLEFPVTLTNVYDSPFDGCEKLATLTFNNQNAALLTIGNGPNIYGATTAALTTLNINTQKDGGAKKKAKVTIAAGALVGSESITNLNIAKGGIFVGTINTFELNQDADATVVFGDIADAANVGTIAGPIGKNTTALTIGEFNPDSDFGGAIVDGKISSATVGAVKQKSVLTAIGEAVQIKFTGDITANLDQSPANANLTTLDFGAVKMAADIVPDNTFDETVTPNLKDVTWKPADGDATKAFSTNAFNTSATPLGAGAYVTFHTTTKVGDTLYKLDEANLIAVIFDAEAAIIKPDEIEVYNAVATGFFYGKMQVDIRDEYDNIDWTKNAVINKTNDDGDQVDVYSAFVDELDQKIYMDRLATVNGKYVIENQQVVVIRVKNPTKTTAHEKVDGAFTAKVAVEEDVLAPTMRYTSGGVLVNDLEMTDKIFSSDYIGTNYVGKTLYAMANPAVVGALQFDPVAKTSYLPKGAVFVKTDELVPSRLDVIWLDDAEDATAIINTIESRDSKANGKIYNLQGIEVDGSYKGIVIVNGKKISQK